MATFQPAQLVQLLGVAFFSIIWVGLGLMEKIWQTIWDDYSIDSFWDVDLLYQVDQLVLPRFCGQQKRF